MLNETGGGRQPPPHVPETAMLKFSIIFAVSLTVAASAWASEPFTCKTSKHTVEVSTLRSGAYQYTAWNKPKSTTSKPDIVVRNGNMVVEGTGICRHARWEFRRGNVQYMVSRPATCTEAIPPPNATGQLSVFIDDVHRKSWWCLD